MSEDKRLRRKDELVGLALRRIAEKDPLGHMVEWWIFMHLFTLYPDMADEVTSVLKKRGLLET